MAKLNFQHGDGESTQIGYVNRNNQRFAGHRGVAVTDHAQIAFRMVCQDTDCNNVYGANGADIFQRKCPQCQGGWPHAR